MSDKRFYTVGTHIGDRKDEDFFPDMYNHYIAKILLDKLNSLVQEQLTGSCVVSDADCEFIPYQKCPKCDGQGILQRPPSIPGDSANWTSTSASNICDVCDGEKIIPMSKQSR